MASRPEPGTPGRGLARRGFLARLGWGFFTTFIVAGTGATLRFMVPPEDERNLELVDVGSPDDYPDDTITYVTGERVFVAKQAGRVYALSAVCTHLGCTVNWTAAQNQFECPCHGSMFRPDGTVIQGPAPRPLDWLEVRLKDGHLVINKSQPVPRDTQLELSGLRRRTV